MAGGMIGASLPELSAGKLLVPSWNNGPVRIIAPDIQDINVPVLVDGQPVPSLLDPRRAAVLADRANLSVPDLTAEAASLPAVSEAAAAEPSAILQRVNSVLQDFTPQDLRRMSDEDLRAVSAVVMDGMAGFKASKKDLFKGVTTLLPGRTREWVAEIYRKWMKGETVPSDNKSMVEKTDKEGGPGPSLAMPIKIVGHDEVK